MNRNGNGQPSANANSATAAAAPSAASPSPEAAAAAAPVLADAPAEAAAGPLAPPPPPPPAVPFRLRPRPLIPLLTIKAAGMSIGNKNSIKCELEQMEHAFLDLDEDDPSQDEWNFKGQLHPEKVNAPWIRWCDYHDSKSLDIAAHAKSKRPPKAEDLLRRRRPGGQL